MRMLTAKGWCSLFFAHFLVSTFENFVRDRTSSYFQTETICKEKIKVIYLIFHNCYKLVDVL